MPEPITTTALATAFAVRTFDEMASSLGKSFASGVTGALAKQYELLTANFRPQLKATYERCTWIKTILKKDEPIDLISHYVDLDFTCGDAEYDNERAILEMRRRQKVVIFGTAGTGKTVFMRYFWLSLFYAHDGKIPIFVELRKLNDLTTPNLVTYIRTMLLNAGSEISAELLDEFTRKGKFVFMLDGFDEVVNEKKATIEKQILDIANSCPNLTVVVSSRPNDRLSAWQLFSVFEVQPLKKNQVMALIGKINYEPEAKGKFLKQIDKELYDRHRSFLSSPLLATMMLMTFSQFVDIPQKVYLFYQQAFETLFLRHDAVKEAFQRQMCTNLPMHDFAVCLSYFCLVSYLEQKFEFTEEDIRVYLRKGFSIENSRVDAEAFLKDLLESVCIMQKEGLGYVFSHRSFQEYFAAYCISRLPSHHVAKVLERISTRTTDDVLPMLFDMDQELVESEFVIPLLDRFVPKFKLMAGLDFFGQFLELMQVDLRFMRLTRDRYVVAFEKSGNEYRSLLQIQRLYPTQSALVKKRYSSYQDEDAMVIRGLVSEDKFGSNKHKCGSICLSITKNNDGGYVYRRSSFTRNAKKEEVADVAIDSAVLDKLGVARYCSDFVEDLTKLQSIVLRKRKKREDRIDLVLSSIPKISN